MAWIRRVIGLVLATLATLFGHAIWRLGEAATTEWINHQITEKYGIVSPSQKQVIDFAVSWALPAALAVLLVYAVFRAGAWWERRRVAMPAVATVSAPAPTTQIASRPPSSRAKIIFGTGHPFETVAQSGVNRSRTVRVKILNETDAEISNGMLQLLGLDPPNRDHKDFLLKNGVTIGPRGHIFVDIAAYNEGTSQAKPGPWIRLLIPIPGGYLFSSLPGKPTGYATHLSSEVFIFGRWDP